MPHIAGFACHHRTHSEQLYSHNYLSKIPAIKETSHKHLWLQIPLAKKLWQDMVAPKTKQWKHKYAKTSLHHHPVSSYTSSLNNAETKNSVIISQNTLHRSCAGGQPHIVYLPH